MSSGITVIDVSSKFSETRFRGREFHGNPSSVKFGLFERLISRRHTRFEIDCGSFVTLLPSKDRKHNELGRE